MRRTRLTGAQATLWPDWRHHAPVTDRQGSTTWMDADHRRHAVCELGHPRPRGRRRAAPLPLGRLPGQRLPGPCALAHNLLRWIPTIGLGSTGQVRGKPLADRT